VMRERGSFAIERLRRRGRLFARDLRLGHIGGRRWPPYLRSAAVTLILALATALVVAQNFLPNRLNLRAGDVSTQDVVSQQSVRYESQTKRDDIGRTVRRCHEVIKLVVRQRNDRNILL